MRTLSHEQARRVYTRIGALQDTQAFYEDRATNALIPHLDLTTARSVFEFGCGTGRFAERLLTEHLPASATYTAVDLTPTMVELAQRRLAPFGSRARVVLSDGGPPTHEEAGSHDRFISNFVLDLLSFEDIGAVLDQAHRVLDARGLIGLCSLGVGFNTTTRLVAQVLARVHRLRPSLMGGCRALELLDFLPDHRWRVRHVARVAPLGVPLEVVAAERL